LWLFLFALVFN